MKNLRTELRKAQNDVRVAENKYLELRDAKSNGCCAHMDLIEVLNYDHQILRAFNELMEAREREDVLTDRLIQAKRRLENPVIERINRWTNFYDDQLDYLPAITDRAIEGLEDGDLDEELALLELRWRLEYQEPLALEDLQRILDMIEVWEHGCYNEERVFHIREMLYRLVKEETGTIEE